MSLTEHEHAFQQLLELVQQLVRESGDPRGFDAAAWLMAWMQQPNPALGHVTPAAFLERPQGFERVRVLLLRMQSGAYS